jgi:hypothetical protein
MVDQFVSGINTQAGQGRTLEGSAQKLPVAFAAAQVAGHTLARGDLGVLNEQVDQFIGTETTPKPQQH